MKDYIPAIVVSVAVLMIVLIAFSPSRFFLGPIELELSLGLQTRGETHLNIPPVGGAYAITHRGPLRLTVDVVGFDPEMFSVLDTEAFSSLLSSRGKAILFQYSFRVFVLSILGGALGAWLWQRKGSYLLLGMGVGLLVFLILLSTTVPSYAPDALAEPALTGILHDMPWLIDFVQDGASGIEAWMGNLGQMIDNLEKIVTTEEHLLPPLEEAHTTILHITDIHNNPLGVKFVENLVQTLNPSFIIDTGDLTDYGQMWELELTRDLFSLPVPYVFIPGNHDSPLVIEELRKKQDVYVLINDTLHIEGFEIWGIADPTSQSFDPQAKTFTLEELQALKMAVFGEDAMDIDILAVHNPSHGQPWIGQVPLILAGHMHKKSFATQGATHSISPSSTGAAGLRGLEREQSPPYGANILYFNDEQELLGVDMMEFSTDTFGISIERILIP